MLRWLYTSRQSSADPCLQLVYFLRSFFQIQNTFRLSQDSDDCRFDHYLSSPTQSWADMKIKTKNTKSGVTSTVNLALHKDLILKTAKREVRLEWWKWRKLHMERYYEGNHILFLESRGQSMSLQICTSFLPIYSGSDIW